MGFLNALKGANANFGTVDSPDFIGCYIVKKGDRFMITGTSTKDYEFSKEDVKEFKCVCAGGGWAKYKMTFKDGKCAVITAGVKDPNNKQSGVSMAPIERFFGDLL